MALQRVFPRQGLSEINNDRHKNPVLVTNIDSNMKKKRSASKVRIQSCWNHDGIGVYRWLWA